jgi:hypothetical protein
MGVSNDDTRFTKKDFVAISIYNSIGKWSSPFDFFGKRTYVDMGDII